MKPRSDNLFHFTKSIEFLKGILLRGFYPRHCLEDTRWLGVDLDFLAYPMVCFCDIPISRILEHTAFYGEYGLGLTRDWGLRNHLTPVIYAPQGSVITQVADFLLGLDLKGDPNKEKENQDLNEYFYKMLSLIKPITGQMSFGGDLREK